MKLLTCTTNKTNRKLLSICNEIRKIISYYTIKESIFKKKERLPKNHACPHLMTHI